MWIGLSKRWTKTEALAELFRLRPAIKWDIKLGEGYCKIYQGHQLLTNRPSLALAMKRVLGCLNGKPTSEW